MKTPGTTPNRTPKGFRALFSLWEGGGRKDSPQKGRKEASQANEQGPLPDPSPLKTSTTSSIPPSENKTPVAGADAAASPAVIRAEQCEAAEVSTWGSNWQSSDPDATAEVGSLDVNLHHQANDSTEDNTLKSMAEQEVNLRASYPPKTDPASASKYPDLQPNAALTSLTPDLLKENSRTPSSFGITPPTLRPSAAQPGSTEAAPVVGMAAGSPAVMSPAKSPLPALPSNTGTPSPARVAPQAMGASPAGAEGVDDAMISNSRTSASFGTCASLSPEQADEGTNCSVHAGCTPAGQLGNQTLSPAPSSGYKDSPKVPSDPRVEKSTNNTPEAAAPTTITPNSNQTVNPPTAAMSAQEGRSSDAPASFPPPVDSNRALSSAPRKEATGSMQATLSSRPEVSSPVLDELECSGGSAALARAGSSLSNTLSRISSGAAAAVDAPMDSTVCADGKPISRHRHQRSGALDFDATLLQAAEEECKVDQENAPKSLQDVPDALFVTADEADVRGSGDTVGTTVVHSPGMCDVPDDGPERSLSPNKYATFDRPAAAITSPQKSMSGEKREIDDGADAADASCPSYPLNVSSSSLGGDQHVSHPASNETSPMDEPKDVPADAVVDTITADDPDGEAAPHAAFDSALETDDALMQSPTPAQPSSPQTQPRSESYDVGTAQFQFDTAMQGTTPVAFGSARRVDPEADGSAHVPQHSSDVHMEGASPAVCAPAAEAEPVGASTHDLVPEPGTESQEALPEQSPIGTVNTVCTSTEATQPGSALSAGKTPAADHSPKYHESRAASSIPRQPSSAQSRDTPPPEQAPTDTLDHESTPKQSVTAGADVETPDSTPVAVAIARCREALNSGQAALERDCEGAHSHLGDADMQSAPNSNSSLHQGLASGSSPARSGAVGSAVVQSSPLKTTQGGYSAHAADVAPPTEPLPAAELSASEAELVPATSSGATPPQNSEQSQQQSDLAAPAGMNCEDDTPDEDITVKVEHKLSMNSHEAAKVTPPNLGSQGSHPLSVPVPGDDNSDGAQSPRSPTPTGNTGTSELRSPVPCYSPAQHAAAASRGDSQPNAVQEKPALVIDAGDDSNVHMHDLYCSYEGADDATVDGSVLNHSSTWRSAAGVNDSIDSVAARSQADSIFGIASDICHAAVGGALRSSCGGISTAAPRSPLPSGIHTRAGSVFTQRTHATPYSSVDTENLLASTDLSAPTSIAACAGVAPDSAAAAAAAVVQQDPRAPGSQEPRVTGSPHVTGSPAMDTEQPEHAEAPEEDQHTAKASDHQDDSSKKRTSSGAPSLPPVPKQDLTPEGVALAFPQQPSRCSSGGPGSGAFRVTDSCADRVWRMLRGNAEDEQGAESLKLEAIAATADEDQGQNRRDSLPVPELPTMDVSEFEALESEALKYSSKGKRSTSLDPSVASPALQPAGKTTSPSVNVPQASGTPPGDVPKPEICNSPSLHGPAVCASPRVTGDSGDALRSKGGSRRSHQSASVTAAGGAVATSAHGSEADRQAAESKEMAIKHALVNQSLTGAAFPQTADCEQLLTDSVDLGEAGALSGPHRSLAEPGSSMPSLPEASDLPSPGDVPVQKSEWNVLESREWRCVAEEERPLTAPQFGSAGRLDPLRIPAVNDASARPFTSTFDATALTSADANRPTTPSRRRKSNSSMSKHSPCSQPLRATTAGPTSSSPRSPATTKRSLSRRTIANITPNHNPNFRPNSPGKTPDPVPVNPSPSAKRSRRSNKAAPSPVSTGDLLRQSSEKEALNGTPRVTEECGKALEYGDSPTDVDMNGTSPSITPGGGNRHSELLKVPEDSPLTGGHMHNNPMSHSTPSATLTARSNRTAPGSVRASTGLMRVPEGSELGGEGPEKGSFVDRAAEHKDSDTERRSLRKSLLSIDPMRVSYGTDGLINLAGEDDCVLFQTDIQAITAALDEFPNRPSTAPAQPSSRAGTLDILAGPTGCRSPRLGSSKHSEGLSNSGPTAKSAGERLTKSPAAFGVSPLRASRVAAAKAAAAGTGNGTLNVSIVGLGDGGADECADVGELQLRLAVALRQAEHWRREMDMHAEASHQTTHELETLRDENRNLRQQAQKLQDKVERQQNVIDAEAFLEGGDRDHTASLLGDDFAHNLRAQEDFEAQKHQLQDEITRWKEKYVTVANDLLPRAQSDASLAKEDLKAALNAAKAAQDEALVAKQKMEQMRVQAEQKERHLLREVNTLRSELNQQNLRVNEAVAGQNSLQERVQNLQKEVNKKDGMYHAKCKELSVAKIRGGPSGIGGGIGAGKLKQQLETVTAERNTLLERLHTLERRTGR